MKKVLRILIFFGLVIISLLIICFVQSRFVIKKVIIITPEINNLRGLHIIQGQLLFLVNTGKMIKLLKDQNPNIADISIIKEYPNALRISIIIKKPIAVLKTNSAKIGIDKEGTLLFGMKTDSNLPKFEITSPSYNLTNPTDWRISKAALIMVLLNKESILVDRIIFRDNDSIYIIYLDEGTEIKAPYNIDPPSFAASLQVIVRRFRIEGKFISEIDFRFEKPIIQLINEEKISSH